MDRSWAVIALISITLFVAACGGGDPTPLPPAISANIIDDVGLVNPTPETIEPRDYRLGPEDAPVTMIMYGDFQCVRCARYAQDLETLRSEFPDTVQIIWRHLPDTVSNDKTSLALQASEAAAHQGRFWDMHAVLFTTQDEWAALDVDAFRAKLSEYAATAGLDVAAFDAALDDGRFEGLVDDYREQADTLGIVGVPTLLINGEPLNDRDDLFGLRGAIELALLRQNGYDAPPPMALRDDVDYWAEIVTSKGTITIDLLEDDAPVAVNNFIFLVSESWFDRETFFLVIPDFYAQTGDPSETGRGNAGYFIEPENNNGLAFDEPGRVAMSHPEGEPDRVSSQFFITMETLPNREEEWDSKYTIFGQVTEGLEIVRGLTARNPGDPLRFPNPPAGDRILSIRIEER